MVNKITAEDLINKGVIGLPDVPGLTTIEMQKKLDEISIDVIIPRFNELIDNTVSASDEFSKLNTYNVGDYCIYQSVLYKCTTAITTAGEWDSTKWKATAIDKELKEISSTPENKDAISDKYDSSKTYAVGDYCIYNDTLYKCKTAVTSAEEFDSSKWEATNCGKEFEVLNSNLTLALTYNENTDYFGTTYNGEWRDVFFAGFQLYYIYANGNEFTDKTGGWTTGSYSPNAGIPVGGTVSKLENSISLSAGEVTGNLRKVVIVGTENAVDLSNYNKLHVSYNWGGEDYVMEVDISSVSSGYVSISMDNSSYDNGQNHVIDACVYVSSAKEYIWENRLTSNATRKVYASNLASMSVKKVWLE